MSARPLIFLDTETTGLDPSRHHVWEVAWAVNVGPIRSAFVPHTTVGADSHALDMNGYWDRYEPAETSTDAEQALHAALAGATVVGANPAFDTAFLTARWGEAPWHYRLLDVESYAMGALGLNRPVGLNALADRLTDRGYKIPTPDHTAAGDVATLRSVHAALTHLYGSSS